MIPDETDDRPLSASDRRIAIGFAALFFGLLLAEVVDEWTPARLSIPVFALSWAVLTVIHEVGHAVVARALGWRVDRLRVGFGPVVRTGVWWGVEVELRAFPIVGLVQVTPGGLSWARAKNAAIYAAGPGVEFVIAAAVALLVGWDTMVAPSDSLGVVAAQAFCVAALAGAALNLLPLSPAPGVVTDGMGILMSPFVPRAHFEAQMARPTLVEGERLRRAGRAAEALALYERAADERPHLLLLQQAVCHALVELGRAEEALLRLRAHGRTGSPRDRRDAEAALEGLRAAIQQRRQPGVGESGA